MPNHSITLFSQPPPILNMLLCAESLDRWTVASVTMIQRHLRIVVFVRVLRSLLLPRRVLKQRFRRRCTRSPASTAAPYRQHLMRLLQLPLFLIVQGGVDGAGHL